MVRRVQYEDTRTIATPEGVELELRLAGLGSRFAAGLVDVAIKGALVGAATLLAGVLAGSTAAVIALAVAGLFALVGYDILFEVRAGGRTPGKRAAGLRVVRSDGAAVGLRTSAVRNLLRLVEGLPLSYLPAVASILVTRDNQRLGDLAAGTVVVHDAAAGEPSRPLATGPLPHAAEDWDVSAVTPQELAAVRSFLGRRDGFDPAARRALAEQLAARLRGRVGGAPDIRSPERFLEELARVKASRR